MTRTAAPRRRQGGQALVVLALVGTVVFGFAALALDQGVGMSDRRDLQAIADSAALAGARSLASGTDAAHQVAIQYAARNLGLSPSSVSGCTGSGSGQCPAGAHTSGTYTFTLADGSASLDLSIQHTRRTLVAGVLGITTAVTGTGARAARPGPLTLSANYALVGLGGTVQVNGGGTGSPSGDVTGAVYALGNFGANNGPHAVALPSGLTNYDGTACSPSGGNHVDVGGASNTDNYTLGGVSGAGLRTGIGAPTGFPGFTPTTTGPTYAANAPAAVDASGQWKPGTYDGWYPNGSTHAKLDPGVYVIKNVTGGISLHNLTNAIATAQGTEDASGGVAFVLDSSDNGSALTFSNSTLNGLDDLSGGTRTPADPQGTHNFVVYASGFTGDTDFGGATLSGIVYLPNSNSGSHGNSSWSLTGSVWMSTFTLNGGGNGTQTFQWVCGLGAISANGGSNGLLR
jgi:Flp pilus assembly protein TadG